MIKIINIENAQKADILTRDIKLESGVETIVADIIANVKENGDKALKEYALKFDKAEIENLRVTAEEIEKAYETEDKEFIRTLEIAKNNIEAFHKKQLRSGFEINEGNGIVAGQKITPIEKAGLYVPGGTASYPSTVLMNAVPAKIAGVKEIVMVTPPDKEGNIPSAILCAAKIAGVDTIIKTGGAQAVAALAYGTESVPKVDKIVGPGNVFVATAKRMLYGLVDIDMIAGPSEILVLADGTCNPAYVAADLLSQAEHDKLASAVLVTDSKELAYAVSEELEKQIPMLPREEIARTSIDTNGKIIIAENLEQGVEIANEIAPEHLEVCVDDPFALLDKIKNAGSIFLGKNTPEALGDYLAGTNHTLPTSGTARFSSPLSVDDFVKKSQYIYYTEEALGKVKDNIVLFANREGLHAHGKSAAIRFEK
ncbi:MAG: histidinol dehydrogenase [Acutalibacteraceae bacterium]|nr:histidinol dehydrogenase [Acutalibacteraceae bacterium]